MQSINGMKCKVVNFFVTDSPTEPQAASSVEERGAELDFRYGGLHDNDETVVQDDLSGSESFVVEKSDPWLGAYLLTENYMREIARRPDIWRDSHTHDNNSEPYASTERIALEEYSRPSAARGPIPEPDAWRDAHAHEGHRGEYSAPEARIIREEYAGAAVASDNVLQAAHLPMGFLADHAPLEHHRGDLSTGAPAAAHYAHAAFSTFVAGPLVPPEPAGFPPHPRIDFGAHEPSRRSRFTTFVT